MSSFESFLMLFGTFFPMILILALLIFIWYKAAANMARIAAD